LAKHITEEQWAWSWSREVNGCAIDGEIHYEWIDSSAASDPEFSNPDPRNIIP
jgi:hypothetical protein